MHAVSDTRHLINGKRVPGEGAAFGVVSPGTGLVFTELTGASVPQFEAAILAARQAFDGGPWRDLGRKDRIGLVREFVSYLRGQRERLIELAVLEAGCPVASPIMHSQVDGPLQQASDVIELFEQLPEFDPNPVPFRDRINRQGKVLQSLRRYVPVGVVAGISAYNFPFHTSLWKTIPALLAGNTLVLRPSPLTPLHALILAEAAQAAGLPNGVVNILLEADREGGVLLSTHHAIDMVAFTGSSAVGVQVMQQAAPTMKRLQLELGGKSAQIYLPDAIEEARTAAAMVCFAHAGQGCALGTRIFVPEAAKPALLDAMAAAVSGAVLGDPADPRTTMGPVVSAAQRDRCQKYVDLAVAGGARVVCGGSPPPSLPNGFFFQPTILDVPDNNNPAARDEIFGPVVSVIGYRDLDHAVEMANDSDYGLSGWIFGRDTNAAVNVASRIRTGTVNINGGYATAFSSSGGFKMSGIGRERGVEGLRVFQQIQVLNVHSL